MDRPLRVALVVHGYPPELRGGTEYSAIMHTVARALSPVDMVDVALYYASLAR